MAYDGAGDVNVFLSPRVGFAGEPPPPHPHPPTSLLTFADMVIALDSRNNSGVQSLDYCHLDLDRNSKLKTDHTYASVGDGRVMTRSQSQSWKTFCRSTSPSSSTFHRDTSSTEVDNGINSSSWQSGETDIVINSSSDQYLDLDLSPSDDDKKPNFSVGRYRSKGRQRLQIMKDDQSLSDEECDRVVKRSSSFENVPIQTEFNVSDSSSEWPQISKRHTPRKSCSFEEVNQEIVSQKRVVQRGGSSGQLHRLVNDTIEFPCWPRKADHTYATATWDGTAASHSLFEQEMHQETDTIDVKPPSHHQEMEITEAYILPVRTSDFEKYTHQVTPTLLVQNISDNKLCCQAQKDDHTYVKPSSNFVSNTASTDGSSLQSFSFATFPRQKIREDHTYFHSGMIKRGSGATGGKEWTSSHSVSDLSLKREQHPPGTPSNNSGPLLQSVSTKRDHNYSTSS